MLIHHFLSDMNLANQLRLNLHTCMEANPQSQWECPNDYDRRNRMNSCLVNTVYYLPYLPSMSSSCIIPKYNGFEYSMR